MESYPISPEEGIIERRFNGGFGFADGLSGFLWALQRCREEDPEKTKHLLQAFKTWIASDGYSSAISKFLEKPENWSDIRKSGAAALMTDTLDGGAAREAARLLYEAELENDRSMFEFAGRILRQIYDNKQRNGFYRVYRSSRKQYFLPAFLKGNTGIMYIMLRYAELGRKERFIQ